MRYKKGVQMPVKTINQIINEKSSQETIMQEQKIGTSDLEIETYYYDEREYLKGKYYNLSNITPNIFNCTFEKYLHSNMVIVKLYVRLAE